MKGRTNIPMLVLALALASLSACNLGQAETPTEDPNFIYTQIWETVAANQTMTAELATPTLAGTNTPLLSPTPEMTNTPLLTPTSQPGGPTSLPGAPTSTRVVSSNTPPVVQTCDVMSFVDANYPDNSKVPAGSIVHKTWEFTNQGTCTWTDNYRMIYVYQTEGSNWQGTQPVLFGEQVAPGDSIQLTVTLHVPTTPGGYCAWFRLENDKWPTLGEASTFGEFFAVCLLAE